MACKVGCLSPILLDPKTVLHWLSKEVCRGLQILSEMFDSLVIAIAQYSRPEWAEQVTSICDKGL